MIPGLIDAHVHLVHLADLSHVAGDQYLPMFLAHGVTSVPALPLRGNTVSKRATGSWALA